jgi:hypothetical protein
VIFLKSFFHLEESTLENLLRAIAIILLSSVKFVAGPSVVYFNEKYDFSFLRTNFYVITGGMLGVAIVLYLSPFIMKLWYWLKSVYHRFTHPKDSYFSEPTVDSGNHMQVNYQFVQTKKKKNIFTPRNRRIIRIWKKYGLWGVAWLTPILLSIPVGTFIMTRLEKKKKKIVFKLLISIVAWSFTLTSLFELLHARMIPEILP